MGSDRVTFQLDAVTVSINAPDASGSGVDVGANWITDLTEGCQRWSGRLTSNHVEQWSLSSDDMPLDQWLSFQDFFYKTAKGPSNVFTYTHSDGVSYSARFIDNGLHAKRESSKLWGTSYRIELLGQQVNGTSTTSTSTTAGIGTTSTSSTSSTTSTSTTAPGTTTTTSTTTSGGSTTTTTTTTPTTTTTTTTTTSTTTTCPSGSCSFQFNSGAWVQKSSTCGGGCSCPQPPLITGFESEGDWTYSNCYPGFHQM